MFYENFNLPMIIGKILNKVAMVFASNSTAGDYVSIASFYPLHHKISFRAFLSGQVN